MAEEKKTNKPKVKTDKGGSLATEADKMFLKMNPPEEVIKSEPTTLEIKIKYFSDGIDKIEKIDIGDWIDLRAASNVTLKAGGFAYIPLGVGMKLPDGHEAHVVPRSSTFKRWGVLMANSTGIIDNSYSGDEDQWMFPAYATRDTEIKQNERICQFRIVKKQPQIEFSVVEHLDDKSRGGLGSTGTK